MKPMARQVLINTAEKNGVRWRNAVAEWEASKGEVDAEFAALTNPSVTYPVRIRPAAAISHACSTDPACRFSLPRHISRQ